MTHPNEIPNTEVPLEYPATIKGLEEPEVVMTHATSTEATTQTIPNPVQEVTMAPVQPFQPLGTDDDLPEVEVTDYSSDEDEPESYPDRDGTEGNTSNTPPEPSEEPVSIVNVDDEEDLKSTDTVPSDDAEVAPSKQYPPLKTENPNVTYKYDAVVPRDEGRETAYSSVSLPPITAGELRRRPNLRAAQLINEIRSPENENDGVTLTMLMHMMLADIYSKALGRKEADWQQSIEQDGQTFRPSRPKFRAPDSGSRISSETAIRKLETKFGLGGHISIPLIHSGIWVRLRPPTPMEFAFLNEKIQMEKDEFGKRSLGLAFTNNKTFIMNHLIEFIENHVEDMSVENWVPEDIRRLVKVTDLMPLVAAALHSMYPTGFEYVTPCVADEDCGKVSNYKLKIINTIWFDRNRMTRTQRRHMLDRTKHYTEDEILKYQDEVDESRGNKIRVGNDVEVYFRVPTIGDHIASGYKWFDDIEQVIDMTFGTSLTSDQRLAAMNNSLQMTMLRQYGHFVKSIRFLDDDTYVDEGDSLDEALDRLSGIDNISDEIIDAIGEYIEEQAAAIVAIPRVPCPHCGGENNHQVEKHPFLVPIDVVNLFFTMGELKTQRGSLS